MDNSTLSSELKQCKESAEKGYQIASKQAKKLNNTLSKAKTQIEHTINDFNNSECFIADTTSSLQSQLIDIQKSFDNLSVGFEKDLSDVKKNLAKFSITLFGRTMTGKSTLMEILTNGNGNSIGKGAQRTTRDVRKYTWNGLEITDVPGIGAFNGKEDEKYAFEAAKSGDMILFLFSDDGIQPEEAECFGKIIALGKPVICVINVRAAIRGRSHKLAIKSINKAFDMNRLEQVKNQFLAFSSLLGQEWGYVPFVYTHLESAFLSQQISNPIERDELYKASRFDYLKNKIIEQVKSRGKFYRIKTFIDLITNPIIQSIDTLLEQSSLNSSQGRTVLSKKRELEKWKDDFHVDGKKQIDSYIAQTKSELNSEIAEFAENHFDDEYADQAWNKLLKSKKVREKGQAVLSKLENRCNNKISEISREIQNELKFVNKFSDDSSLKMHKIIDGKKITEWTAIALSGGLTIASGIAALTGAAISGPLGWAALAVMAIGSIFSLLFKSRQKQEREARTKLENALKGNVKHMCDDFKKTMYKNLNILVEKRLVSLCKELTKMDKVIFQLSDTQKDLAWNLNNSLLELNKQIVTEAIYLIDASGLEYHINMVARIPGICVLLCLNDGVRFPDKEKEKLLKLMGEKIAFVFYDENPRVFISRIIGKSINYNNISVEGKIGVAHIRTDNVSANLYNRIRMAQQLTQLLITK